VTCVAITVEGVLRKAVGGAPVEQGKILYYGLCTRAKLVLLTAEREPGTLEHWLRGEGMKEHVRIVWADVLTEEMSAGGERLHQLAKARQAGYDISFVIEPDPAVSKRLIIAGYNVLTFTHAQYSVPSWRPDAPTKLQSWDELSETADHEAYLRLNDPRKEEESNASRSA
jgi:hypothetical protein